MGQNHREGPGKGPGRFDDNLDFSSPNFCFEKGKVDQKPANLHAERFFEGGCHIIQVLNLFIIVSVINSVISSAINAANNRYNFKR